MRYSTEVDDARRKPSPGSFPCCERKTESASLSGLAAHQRHVQHDLAGVLPLQFAAPSNDDEEAEANIPDTAVSAVDTLVNQEIQRKVRETLDDLPEKDRVD